jgi:hypothetical protein
MKQTNFFWIGYSDLMTSLFFIMMVLFVVTIGYLQVKIKENEKLILELKKKQIGLIKEKEKLEKLLNLEKQFKPLLDDSSFYYLPACKKFIVKDLMGVEIFNPDGTLIKKEFIGKTISAGKRIENFLRIISIENKEFSYLLVIEGNMANKYDKSIPKDRTDYFLKSYQRALAVYNLWVDNGINFRKYNAEVLLCGSGLNGLCRDEDEKNNKRFSIQIIPKVSK